FEPLAPERETPGGNFEADFHRETVAHARRREVRPWEKRQVRSGMTLGVRIEQMVRAGIVLVDAALDEPHAEHAGVEIEILLRRSGNRGDVMKTVDFFHRLAGPHPRSLALRGSKTRSSRGPRAL